MQRKSLAVLVLAAGKGTRMKSPLAKVLQPLAEKPLLHYVLETVDALKPARRVVVVGFQAEEVKARFSGPELEYVEQKEQLGTGHAVLQAESCLKDFDGDVLILCGDMPLMRVATLKNLTEKHQRTGAACTVLTLKANDGKIRDFGRIVRDSEGAVLKIVENKDASPEEKKIQEYNSGVYCFNKALLFKALSGIGRSNAQGEYYLTDTVQFMVENRLPLEAVQTADADEIFGINSKEDLDRAEALLAQAGPTGN